MTEAIRNIFSSIFGDNVILATILIAMLPIIELRGAIPFSMSIDFWGANALSNITGFLYSFLGSSLVVPILALIFIPVINWLKKTKLFAGLATKIENRIKSKSDKINDDADNKTIEYTELAESENKEVKNSISAVKNKKKFWLKVLGLFAFVAIPIPLTGVWTGTCIGVMLGFNFWQTCGIVIVGNLTAGLIITFVCSIFPSFTNVILYIFLACVVIFAIYGLIKGIISKKKSKETIK